MQHKTTTIALFILLLLATDFPWHHSKAAAENSSVSSEELCKDNPLGINSPSGQLVSSDELIQTVIKRIENSIPTQKVLQDIDHNSVLATIQQENLDLTSLDITIVDVEDLLPANKSSICKGSQKKKLIQWFIKSFRDKNLLIEKKEIPKQENKEWAKYCDVWYIFYKKVIDDKKSLNDTHYPYLWCYEKIFEKARYYIDMQWGLGLNEKEVCKLPTYIAEENGKGTYPKRDDNENKPNRPLPEVIVQERGAFSDSISDYDEPEKQFIKAITDNLTAYAYWDKIYAGAYLIPYLLIMIPQAIEQIEIEALFTWYNSFLNANLSWGIYDNKPLACLLEKAIATHLQSNPKYVAQWIQYTGQKQGHPHKIWSVAYAPNDDRIAVGSADPNRPLVVLDGENNAIYQCCKVEKFNRFYEGTQAIYDLAWDSEGKRISSASSHAKVCVWDTDTGEELKTFEGKYYTTYGVDWSPDNSYLVASTYMTVRIFNLSSQKEMPFKGQEAQLHSVSWSTAGCLASSNKQGKVCILDPKQPMTALKKLSPAGSDRGSIKKVCWSYGGQLLACAAQEKSVYVYQWDGKEENATLLHTFPGHTVVCWSHNDQFLATAGDDNTIYVWDIKTKEVTKKTLQKATKKVLRGHTDDVLSLSFSHDDGKLVSTGKDRTIRIWNIKDSQQLHIIEGVDPRMANVLSHTIILNDEALWDRIEISDDDFIAFFDKIYTDDALAHEEWFSIQSRALPFVEKAVLAFPFIKKYMGKKQNDLKVAQVKDLAQRIQTMEAAQNKQNYLRGTRKVKNDQERLSNKYIKYLSAHKVLTATVTIVCMGLLYILYDALFVNKNTH